MLTISSDIVTHRKDNDNILFAFNNNSKVEPDLEAFEGFVDEDVLD
jgi:hypothetical protein